MQNINLLDPRLLPAASGANTPMTALVVSALACAVVGVAVHGLVEQRLLKQALADQDTLQAQNEAKAAAQTQAAGTAPAAGAELDKLRRSLAQRQALLAALQREAPGPLQPAQTLNSVLQALPDNVWLNELELRGEQQLRITGGTLETLALARYAHQLSRAPSLRGTALKTVRLEAVPASLAASPLQHHFELASAWPAGATP